MKLLNYDPNHESPDGSVLSLLKKVHNDEDGAVSIETVLIVAAIALPILIFILKVGWPRIKEFFNNNMDVIDSAGEEAAGGGGGAGGGGASPTP